MKTAALLFLLAFSVASCQDGETLQPYEMAESSNQDAPCSLGYIEVYAHNVKWRASRRVDMTCSWEHETLGWLTVKWDAETQDWDCLGFSRRCDDFQIRVMTARDTCTFTIPGGVHCL